MANLNFQQPPRSIATTSLSNRNSGSFGGSSLSGHVTPTSGMFPQSNASYAPSQQPQLSPNRSLQLSGNGGAPPQISSAGRNSLFGQRSFQQDRRPMPGIGGSMVNEIFLGILICGKLKIKFFFLFSFLIFCYSQFVRTASDVKFHANSRLWYSKWEQS